MGTHPIFESDFDCLTDDMTRLLVLLLNMSIMVASLRCYYHNGIIPMSLAKFKERLKQQLAYCEDEVTDCTVRNRLLAYSGGVIDLNTMKWEELLDVYLRDGGAKGVWVEHNTTPGALTISPCALDGTLSQLVANATIVTERNETYCTMYHYKCDFNYHQDDNVDPSRHSCIVSYQCDHMSEPNECFDGKKYLSIATCFTNENAELNDTCTPEQASQSVLRDNWCKGINTTCHQSHCQCLSDNCNAEGAIVHRHYDITEPNVNEATDLADVTNYLYYLLPIMCVVFIVVITVYVCLRPDSPFFPQTGKNSGHSELPLLPQRRHDDTTDTPTVYDQSTLMPRIDTTKIELGKLLAKGGYGTVWSARLDNEDCAVKTFSVNERSSWENEKKIYGFMSPFSTEAPNILNFIANDERINHQDRELWIITDYMEKGSLSGYLKGVDLSVDELFNIIHTMAKGLSFLHKDHTKKNDSGFAVTKPAIAHRDFKSKNVLLKLDHKGQLAAVISDFGLAMEFELGKPTGDSHPSVGTRRYMAPEILERAISFNRDSFLRIDIYAFALVMWECLSRCRELPGGVAAYKLPYERELGASPTDEDIQEYVVNKKLRPRLYHYTHNEHEHGGENIGAKWDSIAMFHDLCTTIRECWDSYAEARLSAGLIESRVAEMAQVFKGQNHHHQHHHTSPTSHQTTTRSQQPAAQSTQQPAPPPAPPQPPVPPVPYHQPFFQANIIPPNVNYETGDGSATTGPPVINMNNDGSFAQWNN